MLEAEKTEDRDRQIALSTLVTGGRNAPEWGHAIVIH